MKTFAGIEKQSGLLWAPYGLTPWRLIDLKVISTHKAPRPGILASNPQLPSREFHVNHAGGVRRVGVAVDRSASVAEGENSSQLAAGARSKPNTSRLPITPGGKIGSGHFYFALTVIKVQCRSKMGVPVCAKQKCPVSSRLGGGVGPERIELSARERERLKVLQQVEEGHPAQRAA